MANIEQKLKQRELDQYSVIEKYLSKISEVDTISPIEWENNVTKILLDLWSEIEKQK